MARGESFDDMIHRVQTRRISNGQRGSRPESRSPGDSPMFQKASLASADAPVAPAVSLGGGKAPSKSGGGGKPFGGKGAPPFGKKASKFGGMSKGGGVASFKGGRR